MPRAYTANERNGREVQGLPTGLDGNAALTTISIPIRSGPTSPLSLCASESRRPPRVKRALPCGARSANRRRSCSSCKRRLRIDKASANITTYVMSIFTTKRSVYLGQIPHTKKHDRERRNNTASHARLQLTEPKHRKGEQDNGWWPMATCWRQGVVVTPGPRIENPRWRSLRVFKA